MSMWLEIHYESGLLKINANGTFSLREAKRTFLEMLVAVGLYKATKVIFDGSSLKGEPRVMERFYYGEFAAYETKKVIEQHHMRRTPKFAYVLKAPLRDPQRFGETVARNRGMIVKTFETQEEAFEWLGLSPADKPHPSQ